MGRMRLALGAADLSRSLEGEARSMAVRTMTMIGLASGAVAVGIELGTVAWLTGMDRYPTSGSPGRNRDNRPSCWHLPRGRARQQTRRQFAEAVTLHAEITDTPRCSRPRRTTSRFCWPLDAGPARSVFVGFNASTDGSQRRIARADH